MELASTAWLPGQEVTESLPSPSSQCWDDKGTPPHLAFHMSAGDQTEIHVIEHEGLYSNPWVEDFVLVCFFVLKENRFPSLSETLGYWVPIILHLGMGPCETSSAFLRFHR